jgi:hypothetical protein
MVSNIIFATFRAVLLQSSFVIIITKMRKIILGIIVFINCLPKTLQK